MTLTVELSPAEDARLQEAARAEGVEPAELTRRILDAHLPVASAEPVLQPGDATLALLKQWQEEDAKMTPEEVEAARIDLEEFTHNMNAERDRAGARRLY